GIPVLAHPGLAERDDLIPILAENGLLGIEVYYPLHTPDMVAKYSAYCHRHHLVMTGGTDFHGPGTEYPSLGEVGVAKKSVDNLKLMRNL
ncbi:MAG TPA: phosphatase, partial [Peptococcaceae bacterium]|nr:phosphatase [Peptococcaceae bacterium]